MLAALPLFGVLALLVGFALVPYSPRLDAAISRVSFVLFDAGRFEADPSKNRLLRMAGIGTPYREYLARTYLYIVGAAAAGAVVGVYLGVGVVAAVRAIAEDGLPALPRLGVFSNLPDLSWLAGVSRVASVLAAFDGAVFVVLLVASTSTGVLSGMAAYSIRWHIPALRADTRRRQIDAGMPRTVAFVYALTRGGMAFPDVLRALSRNEAVFGEGAAEVGVAVRNIDLFNVDLVTAVQDLSRRTPSTQFEKFSENLASSLQSGRNVSAFLRDQYERYRDEAEEQQGEVLDLLATTAEIYVTTVVAGMLFFVTILLIIGLTAGDTLFLMQVIAYGVLPVGNLLFLGYLSEVTSPLRASSDRSPIEPAAEGDGAGVRSGRTAVRSDGGYGVDAGTDGWESPEYRTRDARRNHVRLRAHRRLRRVRETLSSPVEALVERPALVLYVTVPIVLAVTLFRLPAAFADGGVDVRVLDDVLVQAALVVMAAFAVVYEVSKRRLRRMEDAIPDLLDRLASLNEAGIAVVSSFDRVRRSDVGALDREVDRIWRDVQWGATVEQALLRFESRVRTPSVTRVVTLVTNAMRASNEIGPVLRITAEQARADQRLRRQRRQEMFTYLVVIYISFVVFLIVIVALDYVLIPNLPDATTLDAGTSAQAPGIVGGLSGGDREAYRLVFFHTALIQSALSGLVGGMMGGASVKDGVKHSTVMLAITYALLTMLG